MFDTFIGWKDANSEKVLMKKMEVSEDQSQNKHSRHKKKKHKHRSKHRSINILQKKTRIREA